MCTSRLRFFLLGLAVMPAFAFSQEPAPPALPSMWLDHTMNFIVRDLDTGDFRFVPYLFLNASENGEWRTMHTGSIKPDQYSIVTVHLSAEDLDQMTDPTSYVLMGYNSDNERYYAFDVHEVSLHQFVAVMVTSGITVTGVRPEPFYKYEFDSAKNIKLSLKDEWRTLDEILILLTSQTDCAFNYRDSTLTVSNCR